VVEHASAPLLQVGDSIVTPLKSPHEVHVDAPVVAPEVYDAYFPTEQQGQGDLAPTTADAVPALHDVHAFALA
jgi:hypothetical protein